MVGDFRERFRARALPVREEGGLVFMSGWMGIDLAWVAAGRFDGFWETDLSRWDVAVAGKVPAELTNRLGVAIAQRTYKAYRQLLDSPRFQRAANAGARAQRLLWASTGTKDPKAPDTLYVKTLAAPFTVNTMPEGTLKAFGDHGDVGQSLAPDGGDCETVLASFAKAGIDIDALAARLQDEGASSFVKSWNDLMTCIDSKRVAIRKAS